MECFRLWASQSGERHVVDVMAADLEGARAEALRRFPDASFVHVAPVAELVLTEGSVTDDTQIAKDRGL